MVDYLWGSKNEMGGKKKDREGKQKNEEMKWLCSEEQREHYSSFIREF